MDDSSMWDRALGYGGLALVAIAFVTLSADFDVDPEVLASIVGVAMVAWMIAITVRHVRVHRGGAGRSLLIVGWVALALLLAWSIFQSIDTAAFDDGLVEGILSLAAAPPRLVLMVPLLLISVAMLRDDRAPEVGGRHLAAPG